MPKSLLSRITETSDRSRILSEVGRTKARKNDIAGAMKTLSGLTDAEDTGYVLSAIVQQYSLSGDFVQAIALAEHIESKKYRVEALTEILQQVGRKNSGIDNHAFAEAVRVAESQDEGSRDNLLLALVASLVEAGNKVQAGALKQRIGNDAMRNRAGDLIARAEAKDVINRKKHADIPDALLGRSLSKILNGEDKAYLAYELASLPDGSLYAADLIRSISDDRLRGAAFRHWAEMRANYLITDSTDEPEDIETIATSSDEVGESDREIQTRRGLTLIKTEASKIGSKRSRMPQNFVTSADVRAVVPWPNKAKVDSTFANSNPYIAKFFEDSADGATRLEQSIRYQGIPSPRIIVVQSGTTTLGMVARQLQGTDARDLIGYEGNAIIVRAPIFVAPGATLILSRFDEPVYRLSATAGAFIANAGDVYIVDAEVVGYDEKAGHPLWSDGSKANLFRPFLLTWGDGRMNVASSVLTALGYDSAKSFGLTYSSGPDSVSELRDQARPTGNVVDNIFRNLYAGFQSQEAQQVKIVGNEYLDSIVYGVDAHDRSNGITIAFNTVYGTMLRHGITVSREVDESLIVGNLSFDNAGSGIVLDRNSTNNILDANNAFRNAQDGVTVFESSCNALTGNYLAGNRRDGLKVRNSFDVEAYENRIEGNVNSGVSASIANLLTTKGRQSPVTDHGHYAPVTSLSLRNNRFSSNGVGIDTQGVSGLVLSSNRFVKQSRRLLGGDIRGLEGPILRLSSQSDVLIASTCRPVRPVSSCRLRDIGYFEGSADLLIFKSQGNSDCTDVNGSVQNRAFSGTSQGT